MSVIRGILSQKVEASYGKRCAVIAVSCRLLITFAHAMPPLGLATGIGILDAVGGLG
jgi:hypothetical protein